MKLARSMLVLGAAVSLSIVAQESPDEGEAPAAVEELSQQELDAELERMERALEDGGGDLEEFVPQKPLAADLPVALPSDI